MRREIRRHFKERQYVAGLGMRVETLYLTDSELGEEGNSMGEGGLNPLHLQILHRVGGGG